MADVRVDRAELLNRLKAVDAGLTPRDVLLQSSCVAFVNGHAISYNEDIFGRTPVPLPPGLTGAVPGKRLIGVLENIASDEVVLSRNNGQMTITGKGQRAKIRFDENIVLEYRNVEPPKEWSVLPDGFCEALRMVGECVRDEKKGFKLSCVHFTPHYMESSDNVQIIRHKAELKLREPCMIRGRFRGAAAVARLDVTEMAETEKWLHFRNPSKTVISVRRFADEYPSNIDGMLKFRGTKLPLPRGLTEAAKFANEFAQENGEDARVIVDVRKDAMVVIGEGATGSAESGGKIKYDGPPICFRVGPKTLENIVQRGTEAELGSVMVPAVGGGPPRAVRKLRMDGGRWVYLTNLGAPPSEGQTGKTDEPDEAGG